MKALHHIRTNIVGYVAMFFALTAGAFAAGLAPNSVKSKHLKDGEVQNADVAADAITGHHVATAALSGQEIVDSSLGGSELASDSVSGQDIAESSLGEVPRATIAGHGGYGRQSGGGERGASCDPEDDLWLTCASVDMTPAAPARFLVTGRFNVYPESLEDFGVAECRLRPPGGGGIPGTTVAVNVDEDSNLMEAVTLTGITGVYQAGNYSFGIDCTETSGGVQIQYARVTAVAISPF